MRIPTINRYRADSRIEILRSQTWSVTGDSPDLRKVASGWEAKLADPLGRGYEGLWVAGRERWRPRPAPSRERANDRTKSAAAARSFRCYTVVCPVQTLSLGLVSRR